MLGASLRKHCGWLESQSSLGEMREYSDPFLENQIMPLTCSEGVFRSVSLLLEPKRRYEWGF
jgi:hypothetical protein